MHRDTQHQIFVVSLLTAGKTYTDEAINKVYNILKDDQDKSGKDEAKAGTVQVSRCLGVPAFVNISCIVFESLHYFHGWVFVSFDLTAALPWYTLLLSADYATSGRHRVTQYGNCKLISSYHVIMT